jgi:hypothetical protein
VIGRPAGLVPVWADLVDVVPTVPALDVEGAGIEWYTTARLLEALDLRRG